MTVQYTDEEASVALKKVKVPAAKVPATAYLTLLEVAAHYRTTEAVVRYWRHTGYGPRGVKVGHRVLYPRAEVERFDRELQRDAAQAG